MTDLQKRVLWAVAAVDTGPDHSRGLHFYPRMNVRRSCIALDRAGMVIIQFGTSAVITRKGRALLDSGACDGPG